MGRIVAWKLGEVIPDRRFRALVLAKPGDTLEGQYRKLAGLRSRPDAVIIYCGHNEFFSRIPCSRKVHQYRDEHARSWNAWTISRAAPLPCSV